MLLCYDVFLQHLCDHNFVPLKWFVSSFPQIFSSEFIALLFIISDFKRSAGKLRGRRWTEQCCRRSKAIEGKPKASQQRTKRTHRCRKADERRWRSGDSNEPIPWIWRESRDAHRTGPRRNWTIGNTTVIQLALYPRVFKLFGNKKRSQEVKEHHKISKRKPELKEGRAEKNEEEIDG